MSTLLRDLKHPVAITMWDFGWLLRHYEGGGFEDWDVALDELVERGYNAVRIDCFPHLVACDKWEEYDFPYDPAKCSPWHNQKDITVNPRKALLEFMSKCIERNIYVALSSWIQWPSQRPKLMETQDLADAWEKTLQILEDNGLLKNILYVDFLNEYPYCHGFSALKIHAQQMDGRDVVVTETNMMTDFEGGIGEKGRIFMKNYSTQMCNYFSKKWPNIDFGFCCTTGQRLCDRVREVDFPSCGFLDLHVWFNGYDDMQFYNERLFQSKTAEENDEVMRRLEEKCKNHKSQMIQWMENQLMMHAIASHTCNAPLGNTEGWGFVVWKEDEKNWDFIKWAAEVSVDLAIKYNFSFICTSNFTHPYFKQFWSDVEWHQKITSKIRSANVDRFWEECNKYRPEPLKGL